MPRQKKDSRNLNVKLDASIYRRLECYCDALGQTKTTAIERILDKHLTEYEGNVGTENSDDQRG